MKKNKRITLTIISGLLILCTGCKKLVQIPEPINTITTSEVFDNKADALSAINGIYSNMTASNNVSPTFAAGSTIDFGMSADELVPTGSANPFATNALLSTTSSVYNLSWAKPYFNIYQSNAAIEGLSASTTLDAGTKAQLTAEAKTLRAFNYFYLVNLFGDVPLATTTSYATNSLLNRTSTDQVYTQIINDLLEAQKNLPADYSAGNGDRVRVNKWVATALLARVYLYRSQWADAEAQSTQLISNTGLYSLLTDLNGVFLKNSPEAIWQLKPVDPNFFTTLDAENFIPPNSSSRGTYRLTNQIITSFENGDARKQQWVDSGIFAGVKYYYPYKYKVYKTTSDNIAEYYTVFRLAEQYLIRAEARAQQNKLSDCVSDLNAIRNRAGLPAIAVPVSKDVALAEVAQERRIELFAENGHRWLDLKRTGQADAVLGALKPTWRPDAKLYPIYYQELQYDPNLRQNPGY